MPICIEDLERDLRDITQQCQALEAENESLKREVSGVAGANVLAAQLMTQLEDAQLELKQERDELRVSRDTAEHMAETIREGAGRLQAIVDNALEGIITLGEDERIDSFSRQAELIFGYSAEQVLGQEFQMLLGPSKGEQDRELRDFRHHLEVHEKISVETLAAHMDGRTLSVRVSLCKIETDNGLIFVAIVRDLTEEKSIQSRLLQSEKLESIGRLAAGVAHEINTPIQYVGDNTRFLEEAFADMANAVNSLSGLLEAARSGDCSADTIAATERSLENADLEYLREEIPRAIEQSLQGTARVAEIVKAMKSFSHPGTEEKECANLNAAIDSTITVSRNEWKYVAQVVADLDDSLPTIPVFVGELNQVILNMIVNAAHAIADKLGDDTNSKGQITISSRPVDEHVEIRITDDGSGMPEAVRKRVFDPFFTTKEVGKGTGQGLAIARSVIVDKHDGTIDIESTEGVGTTFIIRLPTAP